jgi:hypothetical protein
MYDVAGDDRHATRCLRFEEIDWDAPMEATATTEKAKVGDVVLRSTTSRNTTRSRPTRCSAAATRRW